MKIALLAATLLLAGIAQAQNVWRCGTDGRSYSDSPCPEGRAVLVADARTAADISAAQRVASAERALADDLTRQRHQRQVLPPGGGLSGIRHTLPAAAVKPKKASAKKKLRPEARGTWTATAPASPRKPG